MTDRFDKYAIIGMAVWPCHVLKKFDQDKVQIGCNCDGILCTDTIGMTDLFDKELDARTELLDRFEYFQKLNKQRIIDLIK